MEAKLLNFIDNMKKTYPQSEGLKMEIKPKVGKSPIPSLLTNELVEKSWANYEPAPIEFFHSRLMALFHEFREKHGTTSFKVSMDGIEFNNLIARAKTETYKKYENLDLKRVIHKSEL